MNDKINKVFQRAELASALIDENSLTDAKAHILGIEEEASNFEDDLERVNCRFRVAPLLIDLGGRLRERDLILRGMKHLKDCQDYVEPEHPADYYYNLANGYYSLFELESANETWGFDSENHLLARKYYRLSTQRITQGHVENGLASLVWTNYGNLLDSIGRNVEALSAYDVALELQPNMGLALGNKGVTLKHFALVMPGFSHLLFQESIRVIQKALEQTDFYHVARLGFENTLNSLYDAVNLHHKMQLDMNLETHLGVEPKNEFHDFLCKFSAEHNLFLSPIASVGKDKQPFYGDPLFLKALPDEYDNSRFRKYSSFLNEIKQEYVLGRYLLVQSLYESPIIDAVDDGVTLYPSFDFAMNGTYVQLLKSALKQAIAVLDKVAYFLYDFCNLTKPPPHQVTFLKIWGDLGNGKLQKAFNDFKSPYLFALFTLARELYKNGDWNAIIEDRNVISHRYIILNMLEADDLANQEIPFKHIDDFLGNAIFALKIARAAVMYLIQFFNHYDFWIPIHKANKNT